MGGGKRARGDAHVVRDQLESVVDEDLAEERLECTSEPVNTPFHGVYPACGATGLFHNLFNSLHMLLKHSEVLFKPHF